MGGASVAVTLTGFLVVVLVILMVIVLFYQQSTPKPVKKKSPEPEEEPALVHSITPGTFPFDVYVINLDRKPERFEYVKSQLSKYKGLRITRWSGTDGFKTGADKMVRLGVTRGLTEKGLGLAGCASSHIRLWKHIAEEKKDWTLILEDDAHFHPQFFQIFHHYWNRIAGDKEMSRKAKILFPGYCSPPHPEETDLVFHETPMCLHGYMLSHVGAKYLLANLLPMDEPVDIALVEFLRHREDSYVFNGLAKIGDLDVGSYKKENDRKCMFDGIIYQNHKEQGSTIHAENTVF